MLELLLILGVLLQIADGALTYGIISCGGLEYNPLANLLLRVFGVAPGLVAAKLPAAATCAVLYWFDQRVLLLVVCSVYFLVVAWNVKVLVGLRL